MVKPSRLKPQRQLRTLMGSSQQYSHLSLMASLKKHLNSSAGWALYCFIKTVFWYL
ncbi:hypothetical protein JMJ77_0014904 [Colletotrichum scovillei]|uniref:Uncharacterized protein n=1 Tax=Colletotrichum scovillei TaxID=1209932 RepID=A0A9P7R1U1_9PEZI|nr:hypothetical protein JMJ77_0014904 [Colletotrichum scovillei]KAG7056518.1 hypothetical protein JMJ78_0000316 [Colletotrichum scovillei]KAG7066446.1 hypothetical protein JMJ76_0000307 [Colletotrichum scovillei]